MVPFLCKSVIYPVHDHNYLQTGFNYTVLIIEFALILSEQTRIVNFRNDISQECSYCDQKSFFMHKIYTCYALCIN